MQHMRPKERTTRTIKECLAEKGNIFQQRFSRTVYVSNLSSLLDQCVSRILLSQIKDTCGNIKMVMA